MGYNAVAHIIRVYLHPFSFASQIREIPRNSEIIRAYRASRSSKVIDLGANRKRICDFLSVVIASNLDRISYHFRDPLFDAPSGGTPCDINVIYTPLKNTLNWLQFHRWH